MKLIIPLFVILFSACNEPAEQNEIQVKDTSTITATEVPEMGRAEPKPTQVIYTGSTEIQTGNTLPADLVAYAKTLMGIPYHYAASDPKVGFDCSGFITYVFNHFNIAVPRSSVDFTNVQHVVPLQQANPGDLILFTGTDSTIRIVGHMGIITSNNQGNIDFIHSTSGKQYGVTITPFEKYYMGRFVKVIRVFK
ncbi:MAG: C40 family peptidase [Chitinophagaceae bacterium]|nr:C40 family peptidase [Chitinophagaceae bacterium]